MEMGWATSAIPTKGAGQPLRVVQWATGDIGKRSMREVIRHPELELVGVLAYDPEKADLDAGELCGEAALGWQALARGPAGALVDPIHAPDVGPGERAGATSSSPDGACSSPRSRPRR